MAERYLVLLRAVNVSGHNVVKMAELRARLEQADYKNVQSYIQSGNLVLETTRTKDQTRQHITAEILAGFNIKSDVFCYTLQEWEQFIKNNPFGGVEDPSKVHLVLIPTVRIEQLKSVVGDMQFPGETAVAGHHCIYLHLPNGSGRAKMTNAFWEQKLQTRSTARNWRTILRLQKMMKEA